MIYPTNYPYCKSFYYFKKLKRLCGGGNIAADKSLSKNRKKAALGLLALSGANVDELVDRGWGGGSYE
jgi:hypothetical protein